jgi:predicted nucleotide-binding protein
MAEQPDLFREINNAVLDLQSSTYQSFERPLKTLARLLQHPDLADINRELIAAADFDAFIVASERTGGSMVGSHTLAWPEDKGQELGLVLQLVERFAADPREAMNFSHHYFYSGSSIVAGIHAFTNQVLAPFVRDYKTYVLNAADPTPKLRRPSSNKIFIVHGRDEAALQSLARFLEKLELEPIVLHEQPNQGRTVIEKFEHSARDVGFAVVLMTPDDLGGLASAEEQGSRARQNVIFELGFFAGVLGRGRVCLLRKGQVEMPSDLFGVVYTDMDGAGGWKQRLGLELKAAGIEFDANKLWAQPA